MQTIKDRARSLKRFLPDPAQTAYQRAASRRLLKQKGPAAFADRWWYYTVELAPGVIAQGQYDPHHALVPRMLMRHCNLSGAACLDLGTMEGMMPVLMVRGGASSVLATDFGPHCVEKMAAVKAAYGVQFDYQNVGPMDGLHQRIRGGFDFINCSGLLYHVWSPLHVLGGVRPLLRRNGLLLIGTNVVLDDGMHAEFNAYGRMQIESNTFWYPTIALLEYQLRYLGLAPVDALLLSHQHFVSSIRYQFDRPSGYLCVLCRATSGDDDGDGDDDWLIRSRHNSWEYLSFTDWDRAQRQPEASLPPREESVIDLMAEWPNRTVPVSVGEADSHTLRLTDQS